MVKTTRPRARLRVLTILCCLCLHLASLSLAAQEARVAATVDKKDIVIGDWITLHLEVSGPADLTPVWPAFQEVLKSFEIVRLGEATRVEKDRISVTSMDVVITAFDAGELTLPALQIGYSRTGDSSRKTLETRPIPINVRGVQVDTANDIKDIKPPLSVRISFREALPYLLGAIGAGLLGWLIYYALKKRKRGEKLLPQAPTRPPHEIALEALRLLEAEKLWQQGREKEYHARLSDILRTYLEKTLEIPAMEMTTGLIVTAAPIVKLQPEVKQKLREILERSDLVKFAKFRPVAEEHKNSMDAAVWFVQSGRESCSPIAEKTEGVA